IRFFYPEMLHVATNPAELLSTYRNALRGRRALIVLDNALGEAQVKELIAGEKTGFLVTSRNALALDCVVSISLDTLSLEESFALLRGIVGEKGLDREIKKVAELCG